MMVMVTVVVVRVCRWRAAVSCCLTKWFANCDSSSPTTSIWNTRTSAEPPWVKVYLLLQPVTWDDVDARTSCRPGINDTVGPIVFLFPAAYAVSSDYRDRFHRFSDEEIGVSVICLAASPNVATAGFDGRVKFCTARMGPDWSWYSPA